MADLNGDKISHKGQKRHKYSPEVKKQAIAYAEIHGNRPESRHFQVDERRIREWRGKKIQNEGVLATKGNKGKQRSRLCGAGRKPLGTKLEEVLMEWVVTVGIHEETAAGNLKAPPSKTILQWILDSWAELPTNVS